MPENLFEESTYKIKVSLRQSGVIYGTNPYKGKVDLIYEKNGSEVKKDADLDVNQGVLEKNYLIPKVLDTEVNYAMKIIAKYGKKKEKTLVLAEATIWPREVKLTVKDDKDKPLKTAGFKLVQASGSSKGNTDQSGVGNASLSKETYSLELSAPYDIVTNKNDPKKREHEIVAKYNPKAKFLRPDFNDDGWVANIGVDKTKGVRQYVNVITADSGCDGFGHEIEFEVCQSTKLKGMQGEKIYIKVEFTKTSLRNNPVAALKAPAQNITVTDAGKTFKGYTELDADGGSGKFTLELGLAGGEKFTVTCGYTESDPTDDKQIFYTWRKLSYQLRFPTVLTSRMTERTRESDKSNYYDLPDTIFNFAKARLGAVYVEYTNLKSHEFLNPAAGSPSLMTKGYFEDSNDVTPLYVMDGSSNWIGAATGFDPIADNREIFVTLCDRAVSSSNKLVTPTLTLTAVTSTVNKIDTASNCMYMNKKHTAANSDNWTVAGYTWTSDLSGVATPIGHPGANDLGIALTGPMTDVTLTHVTSKKKKFVLATGGGIGNPKPGDFVGPASATKCPVIIRFSMTGTYAINGNAGGGKQLMVMRDTVPGPCASTVCHELGHSMGMAVMPLGGAGAYPVPPGLPVPKHVDEDTGTYYINAAISPYVDGKRNLHVGGHCCHGMPADKKADEKFSSWSPGAGDQVCIMWGSGGDADNRTQYCPVCTNILKARDLSDVRSAWAGRTDP